MKHREKKPTFRLRYKLLFTLTLGVLTAISLFFLIRSVGYGFIDEHYMDPESVEERLMYYEHSLENYVAANNVSSQDTALLSQWVKAQANVYLILYDGDTVVYESGWWDEQEISENRNKQDSGTSNDVLGTSAVLSEEDSGKDGLQSEEDTEISTYGNGGAAHEDSGQNIQTDLSQSEMTGEVSENSSYSAAVSYDIAFSDGVYGANIIEFSEIQWYELVDVLCWAVFILMLFLVLLTYNRYISKRIIRLSREVSVITGGNWKAAIQHKGHDEISQLSEDVDDLRNAMMEHFEREKAVWNVNSELITSMSHDIRTPLTSLIGYLDILDGEIHLSEEDRKKYVKSSRQKAFQLKDLSDKMFQYFLVFGRDSIEMDIKLYDADILLQQVFAEHIFQLNSAGFLIKVDLTEQIGMIRADVQYVSRLFGNLFSNVEKYAAPGSEVRIRTQKVGTEILITIGNEIRQDGAKVESTNIGLKTCQKIAEQMQGRFHIDRTEEYFEVHLVLPVEPNEEKLSKNLQLGGV